MPHLYLYDRLIGYFDFMTPQYMIRDPQIVKQISVKDFDSFEDHKFLIDPEIDTLFGNTVFLMRGKKWRDMRATLSPAFTGSKMRLMFELVRDCALNSVTYIQNNLNQNGTIALEMGEIFGRYGTDVIASSAYGVNINSFEDKTNEFYVKGKTVSDSASPIYAIKFIVQRICPQIMKWLKIEYFDANMRQFFSRMVLDNMNTRRQQAIVRPDMIDLLMKAKKGAVTYADDKPTKNDGFAAVTESNVGKAKVNREWTDAELISQSFVFFLAGFDTVTALLVAAAYELALNVDVQKKLIDEINKTERNLNDGNLAYEHLVKMKYMDMVVSEVLRLRSPGAFIDRLCTKNCELNIGGRMVTIEKGSQVWIPIIGFHRDPQYFPNPDKFDPERFSDENKVNINLDAYIPFGQGPRSCLGSRFALLNAKVQLYYLLRDFSFEVNSKTQIPMRMRTSPIGMYPEKGLHLNLTKH